MIPQLIYFILLVFFLIFSGCHGTRVEEAVQEENLLGPQSIHAKGEQHVLMVAVRFPDVEPTFSLEQIQKRVVKDLNRYVKEQSYGLTWVKADFRGWVMLQDSISKYKISPYNFKVDRSRIRKLIVDTMTSIEEETDLSQYHHMLIIPGVFTRPGIGYGMICYCANPGMLSLVRINPKYIRIRSKSGKIFQGGIFVGAETAHLGMFAHDFFHALGGVHKRKRLVPCLYDFERQSDASHLPSFRHHAIYMGPWDIMSQHFIDYYLPPPGISSFTKIRLGWISRHRVNLVMPGRTRFVSLSPLSKTGDTLAVKVPLSSGRYYLIENRQLLGFDKVLPDSGILILKVNPRAQEGSGTVRVINANADYPHFSRAAFRLDRRKGNIFVDKKHNVAVIPLWSEGENQNVLLTTPGESAEALMSALLIQKLLHQYPEPRSKKQDQLIKKCIRVFKNFDFKTCRQLADDIFKGPGSNLD